MPARPRAAAGCPARPFNLFAWSTMTTPAALRYGRETPALPSCFCRSRHDGSRMNQRSTSSSEPAGHGEVSRPRWRPGPATASTPTTTRKAVLSGPLSPGVPQGCRATEKPQVRGVTGSPLQIRPTPAMRRTRSTTQAPAPRRGLRRFATRVRCWCARIAPTHDSRPEGAGVRRGLRRSGRRR